MTTFIGEYTCKLDSKGRLMLPVAFKKQNNGSVQDRFVIKKDIFVNCLILYPIEEWERQNRLIRKQLNPYNKEHNMFLRRFFKGMAEVTLDSNNRMLIPKRLLDEVKADKEIVLAGQLGKIEIWAKDQYDSISVGDDELANMAEKFMQGLVDENEK
jgi:MraZ protein